MLADIASWVLIVLGGFIIVSGAFGLVRFPDFFSRLHPVGMIDTLGAWLVLLGLAVQAGFTLITVKLGIIALFLFFTSPTASHALAHAAHIAGIKPWQKRKGK